MHLATEICTYPADVESLDTYEERIGDFKAKGLTYIPLPGETKYYNTEEGWLKPLSNNQVINEDTHLMEVLRLLREEPFLLVDFSPFAGRVYIYEEDGGPYLLYSAEDRDKSYTSSDNAVYIGEVDSVDDDELPHEEIESYDNISRYPRVVAENKFPSLSGVIDSVIHSHLEFDEDRYGIITLADVNRRGMKVMLYVVFSGLVSKLARKIEGEYPEPQSIFKYLRPETIGRWQKNRMRGLEIHVAEQMNLLELMQVIQASDESFVKKCGFSSKGDVERLNSINDVRNSVMHANKSLIYDRRDIDNILSVINEAESIVSNMD